MDKSAGGSGIEHNGVGHSESEILRMRSFLETARNVSRLALREPNLELLIKNTCKLLIQAHGCEGAVLISADEKDYPAGWANEGFGKPFSAFKELLMNGNWPSCRKKVSISNLCSSVHPHGAECATCPLSRHPGCCVVFRLMYRGEDRGLLIMAFDRDFEPRPEELNIVAEAAEDVALALASICSEKTLEPAEGERAIIQGALAQSERLANMLAAGVAHEINNPLSYILYNIESLVEDLPGWLNGSQGFPKRFDRTGRLSPDNTKTFGGQRSPVSVDDIMCRLKDALEGTLRIRDIVCFLGRFSNVDKNKPIPVNLEEVLDSALCMTHKELRRRARLFKEYNEVPPVWCAESRLVQVCLNLVVNAARSVGETDIDRNEIRVKTWFQDGFTCMEIRDNGPGIPPENMDKVFEPFFSASRTGRDSGIGLAIAKNIVEDYGGVIDVESEAGKGASFTVRLPACSEKDSIQTDRGARSSSDIVHGRILIVDDEERIRSAVKRILRVHEVLGAAGGAEAMNLLERDRSFDLILCDLIMPDVSGMDLHKWLLKTDPGLARRLVFITGGAYTRYSREYLETIDNVCLQKPLDAAELRRIVHERVVSVEEKISSGTSPKPFNAFVPSEVP